ncbi:sigma-70 family RNA polymerase sigma factor [Bacillus horti]|uniref:RNA polymerase sigma-70 factor (ECF subfamily) n=1 Tax=Caldalkalibacillus horti TaxID=77523 RepID=A0ABT9VZH9_9BACI|nr:sigma-70 family RNA polymerase sigma factor [Bacillus horti]MDQ0166279.1 RNA polymerase sigma-70 factor (ECF subfamily) [Bacillus horti]
MEEELQECVVHMQEGDEEAFKTFYTLTKHDVYRLVYFLSSNKDDAVDIMSEVYLEVFRSIKKFDTSLPFRPWFNGLIVRQTQNWQRKLWRKVRLFHKSKQLEIEPPQPNVEGHIIKNENTEELLALVESLSYKLKEVVVLRYYQENTFEDIATILNVPVGTVKSRHRLAIEKLRQLTGSTTNESKEASRYVY